MIIIIMMMMMMIIMMIIIIAIIIMINTPIFSCVFPFLMLGIKILALKMEI